MSPYNKAPLSTKEPSMSQRVYMHISHNIYVCRHNVYICIYVTTYIYMYICVYEYMFIYIHTHIYVYMLRRIYMYMCVYEYMFIYIDVYMSQGIYITMYMYVYMYPCIHFTRYIRHNPMSRSIYMYIYPVLIHVLMSTYMYLSSADQLHHVTCVYSYGVATVSRIDEITGLFCRISSLL